MSTIKTVAMLPRHPELPEQAFHDHWRHPHGTLGARISTVRRYVQSHRLHTAHLGDDPAIYDGIVELWFDNLADATSLPEHPAYRRDLVPDEPRFIDMDGLRFVVTREEVVSSSHDPRSVTDERDLAWDPDARPTAIKLIQLLHPDAPADGSDEAVELAARVRALRHGFCTPAREIHGDGADVSGVRELWWPTLTALEAGIHGDREAWARLVGQPGVTNLVAHAERLL